MKKGHIKVTSEKSPKNKTAAHQRGGSCYPLQASIFAFISAASGILDLS